PLPRAWTHSHHPPTSSRGPPMSSMVTPPFPSLTPQQRADQAIEQVLQSQVCGKPLSLVLSPPGAGKTGIVERAAALEAGYRYGRSAIATQTNEQAFDVAQRMRAGFPRQRITLFVKEELSVPDWVHA